MKTEPLYTEQGSGAPMLVEPLELQVIKFQCELLTAMRIHAVVPDIPFTRHEQGWLLSDYCSCSISVAAAERIIARFESFSLEELEEHDYLINNTLTGGLRALVAKHYEEVAA